MHVFEVVSVGKVVDAIAVPVVAEAFCCKHCVYLFFGCKAPAFYVGLRQYDAEEAIVIAGEADDAHDGLREEIVVQGYGKDHP